MEFTPQLRDEYRHLFTTARVRDTHVGQVNQIVHGIVGQKARYKAVGTPLGIPWWFVGVIHDLEGGRNFHTHLHNGDPLTHKTVHVPKGRPPGNPPFTFEASARDALTMEGFAHKADWSMSQALFRLERYNGFGYRKPSINLHSTVPVELLAALHAGQVLLRRALRPQPREPAVRRRRAVADDGRRGARDPDVRHRRGGVTP